MICVYPFGGVFPATGGFSPFAEMCNKYPSEGIRGPKERKMNEDSDITIILSAH